MKVGNDELVSVDGSLGALHSSSPVLVTWKYHLSPQGCASGYIEKVKISTGLT